jgi:hypothetical protein
MEAMCVQVAAHDDDVLALDPPQDPEADHANEHGPTSENYLQ